jgi:hypothetical protein
MEMFCEILKIKLGGFWSHFIPPDPVHRITTVLPLPDAERMNDIAAIDALISLIWNLASAVRSVALANKSSSLKLIMMFSDTLRQ